MCNVEHSDHSEKYNVEHSYHSEKYNVEHSGFYTTLSSDMRSEATAKFQ